MRHRIRLLLSTTLFALSAAGLGLLVLALPNHPDTSAPQHGEANLPPALQIEKPEGAEATQHARRLAEAFRMPFFSFGSILPRRSP